jgi:Ca-activated chloride channel family protein
MPRSLHVRADRGLLLADGHTRRQRHLRVDVVAPRCPPRAALSLGIVLDTSGSMAGAKLDLAREGAIRALRSLGAGDRLSLVAYNDDVQVLAGSAPAEERAKRAAEQRLRRLWSGGGTDLCGGWLRGCEQVGLGLDDAHLGRCLLLTDGLANEGITDRATIVEHAAQLRRRGVRTSTLGVGRDFDEVLLREMAEAGGGSFYFAEHERQLSDFIAGETGEALKVAVRDATLVVDLPSGASLFCPNGFPVRTEERRSVVELGDLVADQVLSLVLTVEFPGGVEGDRALVQSWLWDPGGVLEGSADLAFRYAGSQAYLAEARDLEVDRDAMSAYAASARRRAAALGREGHSRRGREVLQRMAADIRKHARGDPKLVALAVDLEREAARLEKMDSLDYKRLEYTTFGALRTKGDDGLTLGTIAFTNRTLALMMQAERHGPAQAPSYVVAVTTDKEGTRLVEVAGRALSAADPRSFAYTVVDGGARVLDSGPGVALSDDDELGLAYALATTSDAVKIAFVRGSLGDGAPSHWHAAERVAIVSLSAWDEAASAPAEAFVAYEMVRHGLRQRRPGWDPGVAVHRDGRICWGDSCGSRADIEARIAAGDLCPGCRTIYEASGVDVAQFLSLAAAVRQLAERPAGAPS